MAVAPFERQGQSTREGVLSYVDALGRAGAALAEARRPREAVERIVAAAAETFATSVALVRLVEDGKLVARTVVSDSPAVAALLEGSTLPVDGRRDEAHGLPGLPADLRAVAGAFGDGSALRVPVEIGGDLVGSLELVRGEGPFSEAERACAHALAAHVAAAVRRPGLQRESEDSGAHGRKRALALAGEALAARAHRGADTEVIRLAVDGTSALAGVVWRWSDGEAPEASASCGGREALLSAAARLVAEDTRARQAAVSVDRLEGGPEDAGVVVTLPLGRPARWALQLLLPGQPDEAELARLTTFGVRALHALRSAERVRTLELELERTRALLAIAAQANEQLSLSHAVETVIERVAELLEAEQIGVYLREDARLVPAAGRGLRGPHEHVAERLLELALGPFRARGALVVGDASRDPRLRGLERELEAAAIESALAVPLVVGADVTGLLAVYPVRSHPLSENEVALVTALAAQLAVSVQNALLHEQAKQLGSELEDVLALERQAARQLRALYEISRSFTQSLSLQTTLDAVVRTVVELLAVDAAVIRMPDERGEALVPLARHVADPRLADAVAGVLGRPQPLEKLPGRRHFRSGRALLLDAASAARLGPAHELLVPFLAKGSTAVELPIATPAELLGTITLLSLDPARPIDDDTVRIGLSVAAQAALAIDNARLYQHQKEFSDTMQRSLLPRSRPDLPGIEIGDVYQSSARVEVGGDVYDFVALADGRLAVVLGDVTGHGIDAAADMAMAKFVFRSLAREHSQPSAFLAAANDVVCGEIATGKFITMLYLTVDPETGELACACAGHPRPRLVLPDGTVRGIEVRGLALGIDPGQEYEEARATLEPGASVVVYTDGVVEARRDGRLYGAERLDALLAEQHDLPADELAAAVLEDCRAFSRGELDDDCALVVIKRADE